MAQAAAASQCAGLEPPKPTVEVTIDEPSRPSIVPATTDEIRRRAGPARSAHGQRDAVMRGLTSSRLAGRASYKLATVERRGSQECVALSSVSARFAVEDVTILVDRRYGEGSCERKAILDHEREHVRIDEDTLQNWEGRIRDALDAVVARWAGRWVEPDEAQRIDREIGAAVSDLVRRVQDAAAKRNARIDTPASYRAVQRRCRGW